MSIGHELNLSNLGLSQEYGHLSPTVSKGDILGEFAKWAVIQSPYACPEGLPEAIAALDSYLTEKLPEAWTDFWCNQMSLEDVHKLVSEDVFESIPEIEIWNHRKNGNEAPCGFVTRHSTPDPDNDFIDLGALAKNVAYGVFRHAIMDSDESDIQGAVELGGKK